MKVAAVMVALVILVAKPVAVVFVLVMYVRILGLVNHSLFMIFLP